MVFDKNAEWYSVFPSKIIVGKIAEKLFGVLRLPVPLNSSTDTTIEIKSSIR